MVKEAIERLAGSEVADTKYWDEETFAILFDCGVILLVSDGATVTLGSGWVKAWETISSMDPWSARHSD